MSTSKPLYIYLQLPDSGEWVTVGRYQPGPDGTGRFRYAPSYLESGATLSIDPVNLPILADVEFGAPRYRGLHDVLRDACPDSWGKTLLQREHHLPEDAHDSQYLLYASNADRWGALAVGHARRASVATLSSPRLPALDSLSRELVAMYQLRPPIDARLRKRLMATPSMGGARPKATIQDDKEYWLVKPILPSDLADIPLLEHAVQQWASAAGLNFSPTVHHGRHEAEGISVLRSLRFDRHADRRTMTLSAASLLQTEYPGGGNVRWSYPLLASTLKHIGLPDEDLRELFARMVFNAVVGNDDDHPRNHAVRYLHEERRWRLTPAFDVVPNVEDRPTRLAMQLGQGRFEISRDHILADAPRFGFEGRDAAGACLDDLLEDISVGFDQVASVFSPELQRLMSRRLKENLEILGHSPS